MTSSIRIAQVFSKFVGKKDSRFIECIQENVKIYDYLCHVFNAL